MNLLNVLLCFLFGAISMYLASLPEIGKLIKDHETEVAYLLQEIRILKDENPSSTGAP